MLARPGLFERDGVIVPFVEDIKGLLDLRIGTGREANAVKLEGPFVFEPSAILRDTEVDLIAADLPDREGPGGFSVVKRIARW